METVPWYNSNLFLLHVVVPRGGQCKLRTLFLDCHILCCSQAQETLLTTSQLSAAVFLAHEWCCTWISQFSVWTWEYVKVTHPGDRSLTMRWETYDLYVQWSLVRGDMWSVAYTPRSQQQPPSWFVCIEFHWVLDLWICTPLVWILNLTVSALTLLPDPKTIHWLRRAFLTLNSIDLRQLVSSALASLPQKHSLVECCMFMCSHSFRGFVRVGRWEESLPT